MPLRAGLGCGAIELDLVDQRLKRPDFDIGRHPLAQQLFRPLIAQLQPLFLVEPEFIYRELSAARMLLIIAVNFRVAVEAYGDGILDVIVAAALRRLDMVGLYLHAAEAVTNATTPTAACKKLGDEVSIERHVAVVVVLSDLQRQP